MNGFLALWSFPDEGAEGARLFRYPATVSRQGLFPGLMLLFRAYPRKITACILNLRIDGNKQVADGRQLISVGRGPPAPTPKYLLG